MQFEYVLNIITIIISDVNFMLAMLIILLVAACFLGRYIVISKKMVLATLGIVALQILFIFVGDMLIERINPEIYHEIENMATSDVISYDDPRYTAIYSYTLILNYTVNILVFVYAFIFYLVSFKERKLLRAVEAIICLILYYNYITTIAQYSYLYLRGGRTETISNIFQSLGGAENANFQFFEMLATFVSSVIIFIILYFVYYKKSRFYVVRVRDRILFIVWLVILAIFPSLPYHYEDVTEQYRVLSYIFGALIPIIGFIAPIILIMGVAEKSLREKNEYQQNYLTAELEYIEQYKRTQTETRAFRHDIINNLSLANMMLDEGKTEEASQHLKSLLGEVKALSPSIITGDEMLDCIVAMKSDKMKEMGIDFYLDGVIDGGLGMKPMDVCSIFANALDNAIEATSKCLGKDEEKKPFVNLTIKRTGKFFVITIVNSATEKVDVDKLLSSTGYTSKKDTERHGFGLRNIRLKVEENEGLLKVSSDEDTFTLSVMIPR